MTLKLKLGKIHFWRALVKKTRNFYFMHIHIERGLFPKSKCEVVEGKPHILNIMYKSLKGKTMKVEPHKEFHLE